MSAWSDAFSEVKSVVEPDRDPQLDYGDGVTANPVKELDAAILSSVRGVTWSASATLVYGQTVFPSSRNGHRYRVTAGGQLAATEPSWPTAQESSVTSGAVTLVEDGMDFDSIYDLRAAKYRALDKKVMKAANDNQYLNDARGQASSFLYLNLVRERDKYKDFGVA
jgi:hypothetical protein